MFVFHTDILKSKTVGIIYAQNDWGMTINDVFTKGFEEKGRRSCSERAVYRWPDESDFLL